MKAILSVDPIKFPLTGIGRYTYELGKGLQREGLQSLKFLHGYKIKSDLPDLNDAKPMAGAPLWKRTIQQSAIAVGLFRQINPLLKSRALKGFEDHIFHGPNYYIPPFGGRSVVTIHDLSHYVWAKSHPAERVRYMQAEMELSLKRASAIITDTEYTRQEVARYFNWPLNRIFAVHLASSAEFVIRSVQELAPVLHPYNLKPGEYSLFTGTVEPRKNLETLLKAYARLPLADRLRWPLVIAGYKGWQSEALHKSLQEAQQQGWLHYLGFVPSHVLPVLMAGARLFAYPSHYEGFGLPVLEAMACGIPVVCSNATTLPEIAGEAAALHEPEDVDHLYDLLSAGLHDEAWRIKAREAGLNQAKQFSWEKCTNETLNVYQTVMRG